MKYVIWNKTQDLFWSYKQGGGWSNRHYAKRYTMQELELVQFKFSMKDDVIVALIALSV